MEYKYTLIVSQYYHSRHTFIVHHTEDFIERAKKFAAELIVYKRDEGSEEGMYLGDLDYIKDDKIRSRYNINDQGDIYFIQSGYAHFLKDRAVEFSTVSDRENRGYQSQRITDAIAEHHSYRKIKEIVKRHFKIA